MFPGVFWSSGVWIIPIVMIIMMLIMALVVRPMMSGRAGGRPPWMGADEDHRPPSEAPGSETPLEILKRRFAKGEISKDEYEQMKREL